MFKSFSLNKIALISAFSSCIFTAISAAQYSDGNAPTNTIIIEPQNQGQNYPYGSGQYVVPAQYGGVQYGRYGGGPVVYPSQYFYPSNAQTFPNAAEFKSTYERNQHPPR